MVSRPMVSVLSSSLNRASTSVARKHLSTSAARPAGIFDIFSKDSKSTASPSTTAATTSSEPSQSKVRNVTHKLKQARLDSKVVPKLKASENPVASFFKTRFPDFKYDPNPLKNSTHQFGLLCKEQGWPDKAARRKLEADNGSKFSFTSKGKLEGNLEKLRTEVLMAGYQHIKKGMPGSRWLADHTTRYFMVVPLRRLAAFHSPQTQSSSPQMPGHSRKNSRPRKNRIAPALSTPSSLLKLPNELLCKIFIQAPNAQAFFALARACHRLHLISSSNLTRTAFITTWFTTYCPRDKPLSLIELIVRATRCHIYTKGFANDGFMSLKRAIFQWSEARVEALLDRILQSELPQAANGQTLAMEDVILASALLDAYIWIGGEGTGCQQSKVPLPGDPRPTGKQVPAGFRRNTKRLCANASAYYKPLEPELYMVSMVDMAESRKTFFHCWRYDLLATPYSSVSSAVRKTNDWIWWVEISTQKSRLHNSYIGGVAGY
ncbi:hypothetical protein BJ508DRAFT_305457 [Ascobolus immersus RN42]|uniref:F-box domain-containing protein n=1 Tax=Ascobolus immersus RN42 TaxID=1160509 RepID=A0A3N4I919_ASCIM|nr:hypothetical protein BJ508DRAFT_305457 [Ascobolus immersus RN42]